MRRWYCKVNLIGWSLGEDYLTDPFIAQGIPDITAQKWKCQVNTHRRGHLEKEPICLDDVT